VTDQGIDYVPADAPMFDGDHLILEAVHEARKPRQS